MRGALLILLLPALARADWSVRIGAYQRGAGPRQAHSWAVLESPDGVRHCISWMPAGEVRLLAGPCRGENWSEARTLAHARAAGHRVWEWGPFPVGEAFAGRFLARKTELESGAVLYAALDGRHRPMACNCITAILIEDRPRTGLRYGYRASLTAVEHLLRGVRR